MQFNDHPDIGKSLKQIVINPLKQEKETAHTLPDLNRSTYNT